MRKYIIAAVFAAVCLAALIGCSPAKDDEETSGIQDLLKYKESYVGDNSAVGNILAQLDGGKFLMGFALQTKTEPYGIEITYGSKDETDQQEFEKHWADENLEKTFVGNAAALFALIKNVGYIKMTITSDENKTLTVTRKDIESYYGEDLRTFAENETVWAEKISKTTNDTTDKLRSFFKEHVETN